MFCIESQMTEVLGHYATEYIYLTAGNADFLYVVCRVILLHPIKEKVKIISEWEIEIWKGWRLPVLPVMRGKTTFQGRLAFINYQVYVYKPACLDQSIQTQKPLGISLTHTRKTIRYLFITTLRLSMHPKSLALLKHFECFCQNMNKKPTRNTTMSTKIVQDKNKNSTRQKQNKWRTCNSNWFWYSCQWRKKSQHNIDKTGNNIEITIYCISNFLCKCCHAISGVWPRKTFLFFT